jgi:hypothetical protein
MTEEERNLDLIIGDLEQENRLLRARNERLEKMDLTDEEIKKMMDEMDVTSIDFARAIIAKLKQ